MHATTLLVLLLQRELVYDVFKYSHVINTIGVYSHMITVRAALRQGALRLPLLVAVVDQHLLAQMLGDDAVVLYLL